MTVITFNYENFPSLGLLEFTSTWQNIALTQLSSTEQEIVAGFLRKAGIPLKEVEDRVLLAKSSGGLLENVYGGALFANEDRTGLELRIGDRYYPVTLDSGLKIGSLDGSISFSDRTITVKQDDKEYELIPAKCEFIDLDDPENEYHIRCSLDATTNPSPSMIKAAIRKGDGAAIAKYFKVPSKSTGGSTLKMQDLGEGRFAIASWKEIETKYGASVVINLADGRSVWGRRPVSDTLMFVSFPEGAKLDLVVGSIVALPGNKFKINCGIQYAEAPKTEIPDEELTF